MTLPRRIVLIGPMGAGKSTIGRHLAKELGYEFVDSDKVIEERCGADIPWIFDVEGEDGFRARESAVLHELADASEMVLATGGGAVMREENHVSLKQGACVIYLKTSIEQQVARTQKDRNRPLLQAGDPEQILRRLFQIRDPLYSSLADIVMFTDRKGPKVVVRQLMGKIRSFVAGLSSSDTTESHGHAN